jgi:ketosteroid isomerase-like protein
VRRLVLIAFVLVAGCGGQEPAAAPMSGDERAIRATLDSYVKAVRANDPARVCQLTAREVLDEIAAFGTTCESTIAAEIAKRGPKFALETRAVAVRGDYAMTRGEAVDANGPRNGDQPLVREGGRWLLTTKAR